MEKLINDGLLGIVTGILTTGLLYFINIFWQKTVKPFLVSIRYQGVKIDGSWFSVSENNDPNDGEIFKSECSLFLKQNAHDLTGSFLFKFQNDKKRFSIDFDVNGYMWEGYVTLNFTPRDKRITSYATALLKLHDGGGTLIGQWLFRDVISEFVNHSPLLLTRHEILNAR